MNKIIKTILIALVVIFAIGAAGTYYFTRGLEEMENIDIEDINVNNLDDGTYLGEFDNRRWSNQVEVTIDDGEITNINILDDIMFSREGVTEKLFDSVLENQSTTVDAVSDATVTSNAYLKAIEDALVDNN